MTSGQWIKPSEKNFLERLKSDGIRCFQWKCKKNKFKYKTLYLDALEERLFYLPTSKRNSWNNTIFISDLQQVFHGVPNGAITKKKKEIRIPKANPNLLLTLLSEDYMVFKIIDETARNQLKNELEALISKINTSHPPGPLKFWDSLYDVVNSNKSYGVDREELKKVLKSKNINSSNKDIKKMIKNLYSNTKEIVKEDFVQIYKHISSHQEEMKLFLQYAKTYKPLPSTSPEYRQDIWNNAFLTKSEFEKYIEEERKNLSANELQEENELFKDNKMSFEGFVKFLLSDHCCLFRKQDGHLNQDMNQPLHNYFINSSHNTYLLGNQLTSISSLEAYKAAFRRGAKLIEIDAWDNDDDVIVTHGNTFTSTIRLENVAETIRDFAFCISPYPLIISLENHCGIEGQKKIANYFKDILKDALYMHPYDDSIPIPSPEDLRNRVILKFKKSVESEPDGEDISNSEKPSNVPELCKDLCDLVCICKSEKFKNLEDAIKSPENIFPSISENKFLVVESKIAKSDNFSQLFEYTSRHIAKIYPKGIRIDSSNLEPIKYWKYGFQVVALNFQKSDAGMLLNDALFRQNEMCGYILKPEHLRKKEFFATSGFATKEVSFNFKIISALHLPKPYSSTSSEVIDPYVVIDVYDANGNSSISKKTHSVNNNGFYPVWNTLMTNIKVSNPELSFLVLKVYDHDNFSRDDSIGMYAVQVSNMNKGHCWLPLNDKYGRRIPHAVVFVHVEFA